MEGAGGRCRVSVDRQADVVVLLPLPQRPRLALRKCLDGTVERDSVALNVPVSNPCGWSLDCSMDLPWNPLICSLIAPPRGEASKMGTDCYSTQLQTRFLPVLITKLCPFTGTLTTKQPSGMQNVMSCRGRKCPCSFSRLFGFGQSFKEVAVALVSKIYFGFSKETHTKFSVWVAGCCVNIM